MFSNLYPLSNTGFINLGRAQFLCDLIKRAQIDICAYIFQTMGKMAGRSTAWMCLPFCNLVMKIMVLKGVHPPKEWTILPPQRLISMLSLQMGRSQSFVERTKPSPSEERLLSSCHSFRTMINCSHYLWASRYCISSHFWATAY